MAQSTNSWSEKRCTEVNNADIVVTIYETPGQGGSSPLTCVLDSKPVSCLVTETLDSSVYEFSTYLLDGKFTSLINIIGCVDTNNYYISVHYDLIKDNNVSLPPLPK